MLAAACSSTATVDDATTASPTTSTPDTPTTTAPTTTTAAAETTTANVAAPLTDAAVQSQFDWFVAMLNDGGQLTVSEVEDRFSPDFLSEIPADQIVAFIPQIYAVAAPPYEVESIEITEEGQAADAILVGSSGGRLAVQMFAAGEPPHQILGVSVVPAPEERRGPLSLASIDEQLSTLGTHTSLGVYDATDGDCVAVHEVRTDSPIVLGSIFKLWVLAALAHEIDQGQATWDETMVLTDELRSSPDGEIYQLDTGTEVTLQRLAEAMIAISDNTATDMLISRLGRPSVEAAVARSGVADLAANTPMLSTGNLFYLKYFPDEPNADDYRALDEAGKRTMLDTMDDLVLPWNLPGVSLEDFGELANADGVPIDQPRDLDIEWFATAEDLCQTFVHLDSLAQVAGLEPVAEILEINPGIEFDRDRWPTIRYKGGSERGVIATAWWFEGPDGDRYVVAGGVSNPDDPIDQVTAIDALGSAIELIE